MTWLDRLEAEHDNLGAAISWFLDQGQPGRAHTLGAVTWRFWWLRGHVEELARYGEAIVAAGEKLPPGQLGYAQTGLGLMLIASGNPVRAQVLFQQALALFRSSGDKLGVAITAGSLGHLTALRGEYAQARKLLTESLGLHQELGNNVSVALVYNFLGQIPLSQGDNDAAARLYLQRLAALFRQRGDLDRAVRLLAAADAVLQAAGTGWLLAYVAAAPADDDALPGLRGRMGNEAFQQAWTQGSAMGHQRAVEYALHD